MTTEQLRFNASVMIAAANGETIQKRVAFAEEDWNDCKRPNFDFASYEYRVKPEPIERWIIRYPNGDETYWRNESLAKRNCDGRGKIIHMKEVRKCTMS